MDRVRISNCSDTGLEITTSGAQNSGPYRDIKVVPGAAATANTTCVRVGIPQHGQTGCTMGNAQCSVYSLRGIDGLTCEATAGTQPNVGLDVSSEAGRLRNIFVRGPVTGIQLGTSTDGDTNPNALTHGLVLENIGGCVSQSCNCEAVRWPVQRYLKEIADADRYRPNHCHNATPLVP